MEYHHQTSLLSKVREKVQENGRPASYPVPKVGRARKVATATQTPVPLA